jgi:hypothetical protein
MQPSLSAHLPMPESLVTPRIGALRIGIGLAQGVLLYLLYQATQHHVWPATEPLLFAPLMLTALLVPLILVSTLGHATARQAASWVGLAAVVLVALGWYDAWRVHDLSATTARPTGALMLMATTPSAPLVMFAVIGFFIAHSLVLSDIRDKRWIAAYPTYFDVAWKLGVQLAFSALFVGVTWLVLELGAGLFMLVKLDFLSKWLEQSWFAIPVTAFLFSAAIHLTDVRPALVRGIRVLLLMLLSWILPLMTLLVAGFLLSLPFTGLAPLWATRHAGSLLLSADAAFIVLINTAYQNGEAGPAVARVVRVSARIAAILLVPLTVLAIDALALRVRDHGWTDSRIGAAACLVVASCYALGYARAALRRGWLDTVASVNVASAFVVLATLLSVFSPLADPARLSVNDQVARLLDGKTRADQFDFVYLRFGGARFGRAALARIDASIQGKDAPLVHQRIAAVRKMRGRWDQLVDALPNLEQNIRVWPKGARLPESFLHMDIADLRRMSRAPRCLREPGKTCDGFLLDLNHDGKPEIVLLSNSTDYEESVVLSENTLGHWQVIGFAQIRPGQDMHKGIVAGAIRALPPVIDDLDIAGQRIHVDPNDRP